MGGQTVFMVDDRHARLKSKLRLAVKSVIESDSGKTVREGGVSAGCSKSTAQRVLTEDLGLSHVSVRWVPRLLTEKEKFARVGASRRI